jgi:plasmid stabilization system protein ParE
MAALSLRFAPRARRQLNDILQFIALDNPDAAATVASHVEALLEPTRSFPDMGRVVLEGLPHREVTAYPCRIIYRHTETVVWIVAVLRIEQLLRHEMLMDN